MPVHVSAPPVALLSLYVPGLQSPMTRLSVADVQVTEEPSAASVTAVHGVQVFVVVLPPKVW
jgi:hypothetical protein